MQHNNSLKAYDEIGGKPKPGAAISDTDENSWKVVAEYVLSWWLLLESSGQDIFCNNFSTNDVLRGEATKGLRFRCAAWSPGKATHHLNINARKKSMNIKKWFVIASTAEACNPKTPKMSYPPSYSRVVCEKSGKETYYSTKQHETKKRERKRKLLFAIV